MAGLLAFLILGLCAAAVDAGGFDDSFAQSSPVVMLFYTSSRCGNPPSGNATIGEHVYSKRRVYSTSNEPEMCYSYSGFSSVGQAIPWASVQWICENGGQVLTQVPFASTDCSGAEALTSDTNASQRISYNGGLWSQVLDATICLTRDGIGEAALQNTPRSFRLANDMPPASRPLCAQSWKTMEGEITAVESKEKAEKVELQSEQNHWRLELDTAEADVAGSETRRQHDRWMFFALGSGIGALSGGVVVGLLVHRRAVGGTTKEREVLRQDEGTEFAELRG
ncbi:unnamed protein product [Polarella glacialis]|uniref:Uncharacterized protein n=1 Tax=Polarella glacialis TaxID=89957 RepID=A0A813GUY0_POLGL|nr:unnamed protein product [Polarella glacialis]